MRSHLECSVLLFEQSQLCHCLLICEMLHTFHHLGFLWNSLYLHIPLVLKITVLDTGGTRYDNFQLLEDYWDKLWKYWDMPYFPLYHHWFITALVFPDLLSPKISKKFLTALYSLVSWTVCLITVNPCLLKNQTSFMDFEIPFCCFIKLQVTFSLLGRFLNWRSILLLIWFSLTLMSFWSVRGVTLFSS